MCGERQPGAAPVRQKARWVRASVVIPRCGIAEP